MENSIEKIDSNLLPELQGWKEKQKSILKKNPFVAITDNSSYEKGKKHRTALVTARTDVQKQEKAIVSQLNDRVKSFKKTLSDASEELIQITKDAEDKQQEEVKKYEAIKEQEKQERERQEEERKERIKGKIAEFYNTWDEKIAALVFEDSKTIQDEFAKVVKDLTDYDFEEFKVDFYRTKNQLEKKLSDRIDTLKDQEEARKEREKLEKEKARNEKLRPYIMFIRDYNAALKLSDKEFEKELESLKEQASQHNELQVQKLERKEDAIKFLLRNGYIKDGFGVQAKSYHHFIGENFFNSLTSDEELEDFKHQVLQTKAAEEAKAEKEAKAEAQRKAEEERQRKEREAREAEAEARHQKTFEIRCNRLEEIGFESNDDLEFINQEYDLKLEKFHDDVYEMDLEEFEDFLKESKAELSEAKAEAERIAAEQKEAAEKAEAEAKERKAAETKRLEELKPDKKKMSAFIKGLVFTYEKPEFTDESVYDLANEFIIAVKELKKSTENQLQNLK